MMERRQLLRLATTGVFAGGMYHLGASSARRPDLFAGTFNIRDFGAAGDGRTIDSKAINRAIDAAAGAGGGTVVVPPGAYACYSIRMQSGVRLHLDAGATILAADPPAYPSETDGYDPPGPKTPWDAYQDFGHNHWRNSLIWGENLRDIAIEGQGLIWGRGLVNGDFEQGRQPALQSGVGNKAIALKNCSNVTLSGFSILRGGHFGILATGVNNLTIEHLKIDTNRDGMDIDCCRGVHIRHCKVNSPNDDGICLKSTYALGEPVMTEHVTISDCVLSGYKIGTLLDGTFQPISRDEAHADFGQRTGRIKLGTESNGGFRNITMTDNVFRSCRGIALETVDGGLLEDVTITGLAMHDVRSAPVFLRLGSRLRAPQGTVPGIMRRIKISDVTCEQSLSAMPMIIAGLKGYPIEDVELSNIHLLLKGGGTQAMAGLWPPEAAASYPDPECFGADLPASGLFARHVRNLTVHKLEIETLLPDHRSPLWMQDVKKADIRNMTPAALPGVPLFRLNDVTGLKIDGRNVETNRKQRLAPAP